MHFSENEYPLEDFGIHLFVVDGSEGIIEAPLEKMSCYQDLKEAKYSNFVVVF